MNLLETKISCFKNTKSIECTNTPKTIESVLKAFKKGSFKVLVDKVRSAKNKSEKEHYKLQLPTIAFHGLFDGFRKKDLFIEASGIIILDIDDVVGDLESVREEIMLSYNSVLTCLISPSGKGLKVLYYITPEIVNQNTYRQIGKQLVNNFKRYGKVDYLSVTDTMISTYDPNLTINYDCEPDFIYIEETVDKKEELEPIDETIPLWEDVEDFFETVLSKSLVESTNNNFHYIQCAMLDLSKYGFTHPNEDLSFVIHYAESEFGSSGKNHQRFLEVAEVAKKYPQTRWAYRLIDSDEPNDEYIDYEKFNKKENLKEGEKEISFEDDLGFIQKGVFFDNVLNVAKEGNYVGHEISYKDFADIFRFNGTGLLTVTGIPTHGKSEFVDTCTLDLARLYGHETLVAGFEQRIEEHIIKLMRKMAGVDVRCPTWLVGENINKAKEYYSFIDSKFHFLDVFKIGGNINTILENFAKKILSLREEGGNPKYVIIDPFNLLSIKGSFSGHEKVEEILKRIIQFSHRMDVLVILVAHPFKMKKNEKTGEYEVPDFYSIKGSSAFFEMSYHGLVVHRANGMALVKVLKVKQNNLGSKDEQVFFLYDKPSGRYIPCDEDGNEQKGTHRDKDWLELAIKN